MEHLVQADAEIARGRFRAALEHLAELQPREKSRHFLPYKLSTAEALQLTGQNDRAHRLAAAGLRAAARTRLTDARALAILARAAFDNGHVKRSARLFEKAHAAAEQAQDPELAATILLDTLATVADWLPAADADLIAKRCERAATIAGRPHAGARLNVVIAGQRLRQGLPDQAAGHLQTAETLLRASPNPCLEGQLHVSRALLHASLREAPAGARQVRKAMACARRSGHAATLGAANAELAHLHLTEGRFQRAAARCRNGLEQAAGLFPVRLRLLELLAQAELAQGRWSACEELLARLKRALPRDAGLHRSRHDLEVLVLQTRLRLARREWPVGLSACESGLEIADQRQDRLHGAVLRVLGADALIEMERLQEAAEWIDRAQRQADPLTIAVRAQIERVRAALLTRTAGEERARRRFDTALRVLAAEGDAAARMDAAASYLRTVNPVDEQLRREVRQRSGSLAPLVELSAAGAVAARPASGAPARGVWPVPLAHAAPLIDLGERPPLLARELFLLLRESGCATAIAILQQQDDRTAAVRACAGCTAKEAQRLAGKRNGAIVMPAGGAPGRDLSVVVVPREDTLSRAVVRDIEAVVRGARTLASVSARERAKTPAWSPGPLPTRDDGVFASASMIGLLARARRIAASEEPVLIVGETGTGKEVVARLIHKLSPRADKEFTAFNCSEVPAEMAESVLFGHRSGAYTGATRNYGGVIRGAEGGTLLLDEIAELESSVQPKLLRFLDRGDVHPLGEQKPVHVDVRIIAATNRAIDRHLGDGKLREDLYFRLNIMRIDIPPLRERREEIPVLVNHFLRRFGAARGIPGLSVTDEVLDELRRYDWPGNVRQLENHIRRLAALATDDVLTSSGLTAADAPGPGYGACAPDSGSTQASEPAPDEVRVRADQPLGEAVAQVERTLIRRALADAGGNASAAARRLGVSRRGLQLKRRRLGIGEMSVD